MLGYITEKKAKTEGFTHHGSYYGIPIWMGNIEAEDGAPSSPPSGRPWSWL